MMSHLWSLGAFARRGAGGCSGRFRMSAPPGAAWGYKAVALLKKASSSSSKTEGPLPHGQVGGGRPVARIKEDISRMFNLEMGHPWVYDDEVANISELGVHAAGTIVDVVGPAEQPFGVGVLNRQASIVVRRFDGLATGTEVTPEMLRGRLRKAFAARGSSGQGDYCRVVHGEADGLPGIFVDRFGGAAVATFESVGSARLEFLVQEELTRWMGKLEFFAIHKMTAKKEKWAQDGSEFTTDIVRGDTSTVLVSEPPCAFEVDVHHGTMGHWNYSLEPVRKRIAQLIGHSGTVLDAWSHVGQWGVRCAKLGATEIVLLEESLGLAKVCRDNVERNNVDLQCTVLHRSTVLGELRNMAISGIRFNCVALNIRLRFQRYFTHRHGQFGRWFKPSLKGYETAIYLGAQVTSRGGYLVVTFVLPYTEEHRAVNLMQQGLERASRVGSIIYHMSGVDEHYALASSVMEDSWIPVVVCARLN